MIDKRFLFRQNRDTLKTLEISAQQQQLLNRLYELTAANAVNQQTVATLLFDEKKEPAVNLLFKITIPNQAPMFEITRNLVHLVEDDRMGLLRKLQSDIDMNLKISIILIALLSVFAITVITLLIKSTRSGHNILVKQHIINNNLIASAQDAIIVTDENGLVSIFNPGATKLFGYEVAEIINKSISMFLPAHFSSLLTLWKMDNRVQVGVLYEDMATHKNQTQIPVHVSISDTCINGPQRFNLIVRDLSISKANEQRIAKQTAQLNEALANYKELSETDALTGIPNRRAYEDRLTDDINAAKRSNQPLALIVFDLDFFKEYNDYYGHDLGGIVLKRIAEVISTTLPRSTDFAARFGGEEFVVLLPSTDVFGAYQVAERIRLKIKSLNLKHEKSSIMKMLTISAGVAALSGDGLNPNDLFKQADLALYKAKEDGRNRTNTFKAKASTKSSKEL